MGDDNGKVKIRETFLPDIGEVFVRVDQSQIEDRMCKMYCGTPRLVEMANRRPDVYDAHTDNAMMIFKKARESITKDERYLGKRTTHASQRGMRGQRLSENISKDTEGKLFVHPRQCDRMIDSYLASMYEVRDIYFPWVERQIRDVGVLYDSWGGRFDVRNRRVDADLYREGYSWYLQVEAARWTNQYLFVPTTHYMMARYGKPCSAQVHDEVIVSVPLADAYDVAAYMVTTTEQTREIPRGSGNYLTVPAEVTVGRSWGDKRAAEFKRLPGRDEFYQRLIEGGFFE